MGGDGVHMGITKLQANFLTVKQDYREYEIS